MSLDLTIDRSKDDVTSAIYEYAARRGLSATTPWYLDGIRIEDTRAQADAQPPENGSTFWGSLSALFSSPSPGPVVSIEMSRRKKKTRVVMNLGSHSGSVALAQSLRTYLQDNRAYDVQTPLTCARCAAQIIHFIARYCGRCGQPLGTFVPADSIPQAAPAFLPPLPEPRLPAWEARREPSPELDRSIETDRVGSTSREVVSPRVVIERADPIRVEPPESVQSAPPAAESAPPPDKQPAEPRRQRLAESEPATEVD